MYFTYNTQVQINRLRENCGFIIHDQFIFNLTIK